MIILLSAQYITEGLRTEVGDIPLAFLPLSNKRLYRFQIEFLSRYLPDRKFFISLPADYPVSEPECRWFISNGVKILRIERAESYGHEMSLALEQVSDYNHGVTFLLGSCMPTIIPKQSDVVGTFHTDLEPNLPILSFGLEKDHVWSGILSFSNCDLLKQCLVLESNDYVRAVRRYSFEKRLEFLEMKEVYVTTNMMTYLHARSNFTTERAFNSLTVDRNVVTKISCDSAKIKAEAWWYQNIPRKLRRYAPQFIEEGQADGSYFYSIEYLMALPMNELYVYGRRTVVFWRRFFQKMTQFFLEARTHSCLEIPESKSNFSLFVSKTIRRLDLFVNQTGFDIKKKYVFNDDNVASLVDILDASVAALNPLPNIPGIVHGDLCLSNILYDSRGQVFKIVDPRGMDPVGENMMHATQLYDYAKLAHSVIGLYDHIVAGQFSLSIFGNKISLGIYGDSDLVEIQQLFINTCFIPGIRSQEVQSILPLLFISMLPLHVDNKERQMALLANIFRLNSLME